MSKRSLALFDLDGTLTYKDSLLDFIKYAVGKRRYYLGLVVQSLNLLAFSLGLRRNDIAKQKLFSYFFKNLSEHEFSSLANTYSRNQLAKIIRDDALASLKKHIELGDDVYIVSASIENWISGWCELHEIALIGTKVEILNGVLSGNFSTPNCHGVEKANRIQAEISLADYDYVIAYGDSSGDKQMLELADKGLMKHFTLKNSEQ